MKAKKKIKKRKTVSLTVQKKNCLLYQKIKKKIKSFFLFAKSK